MEGYTQLVQKGEDTHISDSDFIHAICDLPKIYEYTGNINTIESPFTHEGKQHIVDVYQTKEINVVDPSSKYFNGNKRLYILNRVDTVYDISKFRIKIQSSDDLNRIYAVYLYCGGCEHKAVDYGEIKRNSTSNNIPEYICDFSSMLTSLNINPIRNTQYHDVGFTVIFTGNTPLNLSIYVGKGTKSDFGPDNTKKEIKLKHDVPALKNGNSELRCSSGMIGFAYDTDRRPIYYTNEEILNKLPPLRNCIIDVVPNHK